MLSWIGLVHQALPALLNAKPWNGEKSQLFLVVPNPPWTTRCYQKVSLAELLHRWKKPWAASWRFTTYKSSRNSKRRSKEHTYILPKNTAIQTLFQIVRRFLFFLCRSSSYSEQSNCCSLQIRYRRSWRCDSKHYKVSCTNALGLFPV